MTDWGCFMFSQSEFSYTTERRFPVVDSVDLIMQAFYLLNLRLILNAFSGVYYAGMI
jgi:hypothetical protein